MPNQDTLELIRKQLGDSRLICEINPSWSSNQKNHRFTLRHKMFSTLQSLNWSHDTSLQQPGQNSPRNKLQYSISHCPITGGFICLSPKSKQNVGFDLEDPSRINTKNVRRISSIRELERAPDPASLWVAKEALYKSLPPGIQPPVISQVEITKWAILEKNVSTFWGNQKEIQHSHSSQGLLIASEGLKMGFCVFYSNFS